MPAVPRASIVRGARAARHEAGQIVRDERAGAGAARRHSLRPAVAHRPATTEARASAELSSHGAARRQLRARAQRARQHGGAHLHVDLARQRRAARPVELPRVEVGPSPLRHVVVIGTKWSAPMGEIGPSGRTSQRLACDAIDSARAARIRRDRQMTAAALLRPGLELSAVRGAVRPSLPPLRSRLRDAGGAVPLQVCARARAAERTRGSDAGRRRLRRLRESRSGICRPDHAGNLDRGLARRPHFRRPRGPAARTALFFTNDDGTLCDRRQGRARQSCARLKPRRSAASSWTSTDRSAGRWGDGPARDSRAASPPMSGHDLWDSNRPGSTLFHAGLRCQRSADLADRAVRRPALAALCACKAAA